MPTARFTSDRLLAVASRRLEIALLISAMTFVTLRFLKPIAATGDDDISTD